MVNCEASLTLTKAKVPHLRNPYIESNPHSTVYIYMHNCSSRRVIKIKPFNSMRSLKHIVLEKNIIYVYGPPPPIPPGPV